MLKKVDPGADREMRYMLFRNDNHLAFISFILVTNGKMNYNIKCLVSKWLFAMSQDAIVSYLNKQNNELPSRKLSERLSDALKRYQLTSEIKDLQNAYSRHLSYEKELGKVNISAPAMIKAFGSFNIVPSNSYERYMAVLKNKSDFEAISSDWIMVGEDLSFAWVKYLLENKVSNE
jgi:hypothetical protein